MSKRHLHRSFFMTMLLVSAVSISACQSDPEPIEEDGVKAEESVPMSAEPAEPNDLLIAAPDMALNDMADDPLAPISGSTMQLSYACSPELKIDATYRDGESAVVLATAQGLITLAKNRDDNSMEVFDAVSALDGSKGVTQWRLAGGARESALLRTGKDANTVSTYDCTLSD